jgi:hypothetical protein
MVSQSKDASYTARFRVRKPSFDDVLALRGPRSRKNETAFLHRAHGMQLAVAWRECVFEVRDARVSMSILLNGLNEGRGYRSRSRYGGEETRCRYGGKETRRRYGGREMRNVGRREYVGLLGDAFHRRGPLSRDTIDKPELE